MSPPPFHRVSPNVPVARTLFQKPAAIPKAPIVNPYAKFTQPQFDAWIGDITGALRDALGYRAEAQPKPKPRTQWYVPATRSSEAPDATDDDADDASAELDDSFAEVKVRSGMTQNRKGKGRDPREGPGLGNGKGGRGAPIEIDLDSEEEEEKDSEADEQEWDEDEEGIQTSDEEEEEENALRNGESSAHADARYQRYADRREDESEEEEENVWDPDIVDDGDRDVSGSPQADEYPLEEHSDEGDTNPVSHQPAPMFNHIPECDYNDEGEDETGSESEDEDVVASSPPRRAAHPQLHPSQSRYVLEDMFEQEDDELDDGRSSPPRRERGEPETIEVGSDDEENGPNEEEYRREDEGLAPEVVRNDYDLPSEPRYHAATKEQNRLGDDDILPASSPILSSPVEPDHSFLTDAREVFDAQLDVLEDDAEMHGGHAKLFDWDHPPAFTRDEPVSDSGLLAAPVEVNDIFGSDDAQLETFGTSDVLPTFESHSQAAIEDESLQFDEDGQGDVAEPYFITEIGGDERGLDSLGLLDAQTVSRSVPADSLEYIAEQSPTNHEPDAQNTSLDFVTVDGDLEGTDMTERENLAMGDEHSIQEVDAGEYTTHDIQDGQDLLSARDVSVDTLQKLETNLESDPDREMEIEPQSSDPQVTVVQNSDGTSLLTDIPMPVFADPTVDDPSAPQPPITPPRVHMVLSLPGSPFVPSIATTQSGQPAHVLLSDPMAMLKTMHNGETSGLFTPGSEVASASATPDPPTQPDHESSVVSSDPVNAEDLSVDSHNILGMPSQITRVNGESNEGAKMSLHPATGEQGVDDPSSNCRIETEQVNTVPAVQEWPGIAFEAEQEELQLPEGLSVAVASSAAKTADGGSTLARDEGSTAASDVALDIQILTSPIPQNELGSLSPPTSPTSYSTKTVAADTTEPFPNSLSLSIERIRSMGQEVSDIPGPSSSIADRDLDGTDNVDLATDAGDIDEMVLQYPSESDAKDATTGDTARAESVDIIDDVSEGSETDADGDDDPDYEDASSLASSVAEEIEVAQAPEGKQSVDQESAVGPTVEAASNESGPSENTAEDKYQIIAEPPVPGLDADRVVPDSVQDVGLAEVDASPTEPAEVYKALQNDSPEVLQAEDTGPSSVDVVISVANGHHAHGFIDGSVDSKVKSVVAMEIDAPIEAQSPPLKRKREHSLAKEISSSSDNLGKVSESRLSRLHNPTSNGKGKGKAKEEYTDNDDASSNSGASSAARLLDPGSRGTSRASSVASVRSTQSSAVVESSPSAISKANGIIKVARSLPRLPPPPLPHPPTLMHAHSHNRALPHPLSRQPTQQRLLQRTPSRTNVNVHINEEAPSPSTSSMQMLAPPRRVPPAAGSPVTRSNCRYHRITLPENEESADRVSFLVPGCSLGDTELMKEEDIKDMGVATQAEADRMIQDIDSLHLNLNLMGVVRQLVGVDLLREQEIYYLPRPGEEQLRKPRRREASKLRISSGGSFASEGAMSPGMRSPASISSRPPTSAAGSSSTASEQARRRRKDDRGSPAASWAYSQGESTDEEEPSTKRIRGADGDIRAAEEEGIAAAASGSPRVRTRRSRRMDKEAAEYKPGGPEESGESSSDEENKGGRKKRKGKGRKRARQSEAGPTQDGTEDRKAKKLKTLESIDHTT
ncbi:hypothetical protein B0H15DRAFT_572261 [Mycena belliarum]|uniref:Uncharacterized protein n=1 Tax=Mycena belliarum TaxID=1033014 RepID=A0AAD6TSM9_9AGAR|nr:hypothetical protein B0H15DRAFT_572261 [Mycena belliae]